MGYVACPVRELRETVVNSEEQAVRVGVVGTDFSGQTHFAAEQHLPGWLDVSAVHQRLGSVRDVTDVAPDRVADGTRVFGLDGLQQV